MTRIGLALVVLLGCGGAPAEPDGTGSAAAGTALSVKPHVPVPSLDREVDVFVGPDRVATLSAGEVTAGVELDILLSDHPVDTWASVVVYRDGNDSVEWLEPATNFTDLVPLVFLAGTRPAVGFFAPERVATRTNAVVETDAVTAVRVELAKRKRTQLEELAAGCRPEPRGELAVIVVPEHWKGTTTQFNIPMHWRSDLVVDLGDGAIGARVGTLTQDAVEWTQRCVYDLFRRADRHGRWGVHGRLRHTEGGCIDSNYELTCSGDKLSLLGYYPNGRYVERGLLSAVP